MKRYFVNSSNEIVGELGQGPLFLLKCVTEEEAAKLKWAPGTAKRWAQEKAKGYKDPTTKAIYSLDDDSVLVRSANLSTLLAALQTGVIRNTDPQKTWDINNKEITLTTSEYVALMIRMGTYYRSIYGQYAP